MGKSKNTSPVGSNISCIHYNLHHCIEVTFNFQEILSHYKSYIAFIQEPYCIDQEIKGVPSHATLFDNTDPGITPRAAILVSNNLAKNIFTLSHLSNKDMCVIQIYNFSPSINSIICVSIYLAHEYSIPTNDLKEVIKYAEQYNLPLIIAGDVNAHHTAWGSTDINDRGNDLLDFITLNNLTWANEGNTPTFVTRTREEVLDLTIHTHSLTDTIIDWRVNTKRILSDHRMVEFNLKHTNIKPIAYRSIKDTDWIKFNKILSSYLQKINHIPTEPNRDELDDVVDKLTSAIQKAYHLSCPLKYKRGSTKPTWWTADLSFRRKNLRYLHKKAKNKNTDSTWKSYREGKKEFQKILRKSKTSSWRNFCTNINTISASAKLSKILKFKRIKTLGSIARPDGTYTTNPAESLNTLLDSLIPADSSAGPDLRYNNTNNMDEIIHTTFSLSRLNKAIADSTLDKAPGPDNIKGTLVSMGWQHIREHIQYIYSHSLRLGYVPKEWQHSRGHILAKPGKEDYSIPKSYRLINLSSFLLKLMEKLIQWYIQFDLQIDNKLSSSQFGFRRGFSTEAALHKIISRIEQSISEGKYALGIFLDIEGAFDNIKHSSIREALYTLGIPNTIGNWIGYLISNRNITVTLANITINRTVTKGCPQGGILSPFLWNIVVNSLLTNFDSAKSVLNAFADDLSLIIQGFDPSTLRSLASFYTAEISVWCKHHGLNLSALKTKLIMFTWNRKWDRDPIEIDGTMIPFVNETKLLGIILDSKLSWGPHITAICKKAHSLTHLVNRALGKIWGISPKVSKWVYTAIIRPILLYGCIIWINGIIKSIYLKKKLISVQRRANLQILNALNSSPISSLNILSHLPPITSHIKYTAIITFLKLKANGTWIDNNTTKRGKMIPHGTIIKSYYASLPFYNKQIDLTKPMFFLENNYTISIEERTEALKLNRFDDLDPLLIFTDGSVKNNKAGSGYIIIDKKGSHSHEQFFALGENISIFQAETHAILKASEYIINFCKNRNIIFLTDSQAVIKALNNITSRTITVSKCILSLNKAAETNITTLITWIPGHTNTYGNDRADYLANIGSDTSITTQLPLPLSFVKSCIKTWYKKQDLLEWKKEKVCKENKPILTYILENNIFLIFTNRIEARAISQLLTGHCTLNYFLNKLKPSISPLCPMCKWDKETPDHFLGKCPATYQQRYSYFGSYTTNLHDIFMRSSLKTIIKYAKSTHRWPNGIFKSIPP